MSNYKATNRRAMRLLIALLPVFFAGASLQAQITVRNAEIMAVNPIVDQQFFRFDVMLKPTSDWGSGTYDRALGSCSWFFRFNTQALGQPELAFVAPQLDSLGGYENTTQIIADRLGITTLLNLSTYSGGQFNPGETYHLFTVRMQIIDANAESGIAWDTLNTGVLTLLERLVDTDYLAAANVPLVTTGTNPVGESVLPRDFALGQNYPNPFNPSTSIPFDVPAGTRAEPLSLDIFDVTGRKVRTLVAGTLQPGNYARVWDGYDDAGYQVASGVFFVRFTVTGYTATRRIILIR